MIAPMSALDGWIDVCRAGTWTDTHNRRVTVSASDFDQMVAGYSAQDPAPVVVGHPSTDAPAYAWVSSLRRVGDRLQAQLRDIAPAFRAAVESNQYAGRSIAATADNRLVHLGFLGGRAPAVPGLAPTQFSQPVAKTIELAASDLTTRQGARFIARAVARLLRGLREDKIAEDGVEAADAVYPSWDIDHLITIAEDMDDEGPVMASAKPPQQVPQDIMEDPDMGRTPKPATLDETALAARAAELDAREAKLAEDEAQAQSNARLASAQATLAPHVQAGRILPAEEPALAALLASLPQGDEALITFAGPQDGAQVREAPGAVLQRLFAAMPKRVDFAEHAGGPVPAVPETGRVDHEQVAAEARALMAEAAGRGEIITSIEAVDRVRATRNLTR